MGLRSSRVVLRRRPLAIAASTIRARKQTDVNGTLVRLFPDARFLHYIFVPSIFSLSTESAPAFK